LEPPSGDPKAGEGGEAHEKKRKKACARKGINKPAHGRSITENFWLKKKGNRHRGKGNFGREKKNRDFMRPVLTKRGGECSREDMFLKKTVYSKGKKAMAFRENIQLVGTFL